ncbi:hypothetical protein [Nocardioides humi]|uniref:DUF222 domain-containing protein n=1 Tax=Nocardioides humi TaxID=449461 RepID=A0ABN2AA31_9ACTN|nr:hypothetical protein [Nocardioides humi]
MDDEVLHGYLQHHWVGSTAGVSLFQRVARSHGDPAAATVVGELGEEVAGERETLRGLMTAVGVRPSRVGALAARAGEVAGRLKPNGRVLSRSPLTDVLELEALRDAVYGKRGGWEVLRSVADDDPRLDAALLDDLLARSDRQLERLQGLHVGVSRKRLLA